MSEERRAYWSKLLAEHKASGTTIQSFCTLHGVSDHSFYIWRRSLRSEEPAPLALLKTVAGGLAPSNCIFPAASGCRSPTT